jgi:hypothetical protein
MEIVSEHVHRVLAYVAALNRHGVRPGRRVVDEFARRPSPRPTARLNKFQILAQQMVENALGGVETVEGETFSEYLVRLSWVKNEDELELTAVGRALLKALNAPVLDEGASDVFEVVLDPDNPFAYAQALGALSQAERALLVEPYLRLEQLIDVEKLGNIERVLVGSRLSGKDRELLATGLAALPADRPLEIRVAKDLHDRYLIPATEGRVTMLGMSLGGIGKKVSTITTLGEVASIALRDAHEEIWTDAEVLRTNRAPSAEADPGAGDAPEA